MNEEAIFTSNQYEVYVVREELEDLGGGRRGNYVLHNSETKVNELLFSTFIQAVSAALELSEAEANIHEHIEGTSEDGSKDLH